VIYATEFVWGMLSARRSQEGPDLAWSVAMIVPTTFDNCLTSFWYPRVVVGHVHGALAGCIGVDRGPLTGRAAQSAEFVDEPGCHYALMIVSPLNRRGSGVTGCGAQLVCARQWVSGAELMFCAHHGREYEADYGPSRPTSAGSPTGWAMPYSRTAARAER